MSLTLFSCQTRVIKPPFINLVIYGEHGGVTFSTHRARRGAVAATTELYILLYTRTYIRETTLYRSAQHVRKVTIILKHYDSSVQYFYRPKN